MLKFLFLFINFVPGLHAQTKFDLNKKETWDYFWEENKERIDSIVKKQGKDTASAIRNFASVSAYELKYPGFFEYQWERFAKLHPDVDLSGTFYSWDHDKNEKKNEQTHMICLFIDRITIYYDYINLAAADERAANPYALEQIKKIIKKYKMNPRAQCSQAPFDEHLTSYFKSIEKELSPQEKWDVENFLKALIEISPASKPIFAGLKLSSQSGGAGDPFCKFSKDTLDSGDWSDIPTKPSYRLEICGRCDDLSEIKKKEYWMPVLNDLKGQYLIGIKKDSSGPEYKIPYTHGKCTYYLYVRPTEKATVAPAAPAKPARGEM